MSNADSANADNAIQLLLPIAEQEGARDIAIKSIRLLNCWLGVATKEGLGNTFCIDCEYLNDCKMLYIFFDKAAGLHPAACARKVLRRFRIESEYL